MSTVFVGDSGTEIVLDCGVDVSTATKRSIFVRNPSRVRVEWAATSVGTNAIKCVTTAESFDMAGTWQLQAYVEMPGWKGYGEVATLKVVEPL